MITSSQKLYQIGATVFTKAATDPAFRALALRDGKAAVEQVTGGPLPDGLKIHFVEGEGADITWGLPPLHQAGELSDRELEAVAGGRDSESSAAAAEGAGDAALEGVAAVLGRE